MLSLNLYTPNLAAPLVTVRDHISYISASYTTYQYGKPYQSGLLGAYYYARDAEFPTSSTVVAITSTLVLVSRGPKTRGTSP